MESKKTRNIIISIVVILVVICLCVGLVTIGGVGVALVWPFSRASETAVPTQITETAPGATEERDAIPSDQSEAMGLIEQEVSQLRGLNASSPVARTLISETELEAIVREDFFADYTDEESQQDAWVLSVMGLLPPDFDLKEFYNLLYSEQIAGFYDDEAAAMYVVQGGEFGGSEKMTYAHEYTHVLQDQNYGLDEGLGLNDEACLEDSEKCAAVQALIEGDATLSEIEWVQTYATLRDIQDIVDSYDSYESPILDSAPAYMVADLGFPYDSGYVFVEALFNAGGFEAVDEAYRNLPVSTEQILHPERYPGDVPVAVILPDLTDLLDSGWYLYDQNVMGEWYTYLILNRGHDAAFQLPDEQAKTAAEGWGGDAYAFYLNSETDDVIFVMDTVWDTTQDAGEFANTFIEYASQRWDPGATSSVRSWTGVDGTVVFWQDDDRTVWVIAPTFEMGAAILAEVK